MKHTALITNSSLAINPRVRLVDIAIVRSVRGCDAESVLASVCDLTHPQCLRWVFNISQRPTGIRNLRFWADEILGPVDKLAEPDDIIEKILPRRPAFPRTEIEIQWTVSAWTISRLVRAGEITETNHRLSRASLAEFLKRRLQ